MIECEICGQYFHADEITNCPRCGVDICARCFENHIRYCGDHVDMDDEDNENDEIANLPRECPECRSDLELDVDYDKTTLLCPQCEYELDVTHEFQKIEYTDD